MVVLLFACADAIVVVDGGSSDSGTDSGDTGSQQDSADTADSSDTGTEVVTDFSHYNGVRAFTVNDWFTCAETVVDSGEELTAGPEFLAVTQSCRACTRVYANTPDPDSLCGGNLPLGPSWRGIEFGTDTAIVHIFTDNGTGLAEGASDDDAGWDGETVKLAYSYDIGATVNVAGSFTFPTISGQ